VFADVLIPLWLKARGELTGMMIASANQEKAAGLLGDVQAELMENRRYGQDFGQQHSIGNWTDGYFVTTDGWGFWAFGRGQSPRGTRQGEKRPNYGVIDDIDDKAIVKNNARVREATDWVLGNFYGALSIQGARLVVAGNRIAQHSILAHLVGDVEPEDRKRSGITHIKVFAIESKSRRKAGPQHGQPAWKERYSLAQLVAKMDKMGYRNARPEYFHEDVQEGFIFKAETITWAAVPRLSAMDALITYCDPSYKDTKKNDYKAIVLLGKSGPRYYVINAWVRQETKKAMVTAHYDLAGPVAELNCPHYIEANFIQDLLLEQYDNEAQLRGLPLRIRPDKPRKPQKTGRIEDLEPLWSGGMLIFNEAERKSHDMQTLVKQFTGFPFAHDDGPDAVEGGIYLLNKRSGSSRSGAKRMGRFRKNTNR
jgi:phage terminase large subunit-like protein